MNDLITAWPGLIVGTKMDLRTVRLTARINHFFLASLSLQPFNFEYSYVRLYR